MANKETVTMRPTSLLLAVVAALAIVVPARNAFAGLGTRSHNNWSWVDTKGTGHPTVLPRYATVPVRTATGTGAITLPQVSEQVWSWTTNTARPLETWTITATNATTFTVVGSVSGAQANATVGAPYSAAGIAFTIAPGPIDFIAGDMFVFQIVDRYDLSTIAGAQTYTIPASGALPLNVNFNMYAEGRGNEGLVVYDAGYLAIVDSSLRLIEDFYPRQRANSPLPARELVHDQAAFVMPFWDELVQKPSSRVRIARLGGRLIVEFNDFAHQSDATASYTFQVVMFENTEHVRFHYIRLQNGTGTSADGSTATIGLQRSGLYTALSYSTNTATLNEGLVIDFGNDSDGDYLPNAIEQQYGTNPVSPFSDGGTPAFDSAQLVANLDPTNPADNPATDTDGDTLTDLNETIIGTNPAMADTDGDGVSDGIEWGNYDPLAADTDGDGLSDGQEDADHSGTRIGSETSPTAWDTDGDGVDDGTETAQTTDPVDAGSGRLHPPIELDNTTVYGLASAVDSHGNLHVAWTYNQDNGTPDELHVALLTKTGAVYAVAVDATLIDTHTGIDDRLSTIVTVPGGVNAGVDKTLIVNHSRGGFAFFTTIDFGLAARDGSASTAATIVTSSRMLDIPLAMNHPQMKLAGGKLHLVFQGQAVLGTQYFKYNLIDRGTYYMQLELDGSITVAPTQLFAKGIPAHHHSMPRLAVDSGGNIHSVVRGGTCRREQGPTDCAFYYTKLSSAGTAVIPTTKLQLQGNGGLHKWPELLVSPNGLVNVIYTTTAPMITAGGAGGYSIGNEVRLYSFATVNNRITTVIDQKPLLSVIPDKSFDVPFDLAWAVYRTPSAVLDAGGNIHLFVTEDGNLGEGLYLAFDPSGARKLGPTRIGTADGRIGNPIDLVGNTVLFTYKDRGIHVRELDITGHGLDLSGGSQVPIPPTEITITSVLPASIASGGSGIITVLGTGFISGSTISIGGVTLTGVVAFDATNLAGALDGSGLADGVYDVTVTNPDGTTATLPMAFTVGAPSTDDGCCGTTTHPSGVIALIAFVLALWPRRRRRATGAIVTLLACAYVMQPATASAGLGTRDHNGIAWTDSKAGGPMVVPRYVTVPVRTATGDGTINQPVLGMQLWNWTTNAPVPVETWTLTATSATTFTVVGSVTGALTNATVGSGYVAPNGGPRFLISAGGIPFVAGDTFVFQVVTQLDASTLPGAVSRMMPGTGTLIIDAPWTLTMPQSRTARTLVVYREGYIAMVDDSPKMLFDFGAPALPNAALPARSITHDEAEHLIPFWDELVTKSTSRIWTATHGRSGERVYIIEYRDFAHASDPTASYTFQVLFYEDSYRIRFQYITLNNGTGSSANGSTATVGLQARLSQRYTASSYSANAPTLAAGLVIEFGEDQDGDRLPTSIERQYGTNDANPVSDGGSPALFDSAQIIAGIDPTIPGDNASRATDTDGDTVLDANEGIFGTSATLADTDGDGLSDFVELDYGTDPLVTDTDGDGLADGVEDADGDGGTSTDETDPRSADTDGDGMTDGAEVALGTDKLLDTSSRLTVPLELDTEQIAGIASSLDSKGNLHVAWTRRNANNIPDDLYVALLAPTGPNGTYVVAVAGTLIDTHLGLDDRNPALVTIPGAAGTTVDRTYIVDHSHGGHAFFTALDFGLATRDGTASTAATIITASRLLDLPVAVNHPQMTASGNRLHVVFQGQPVIGTERFYSNHTVRGSYYLQLDTGGDIVVAPTLLFEKQVPSHHHSFPRIAADTDGNIHSIVRGGSCRWTQGPAGCALHYTKLSASGGVLIPTTQLQLMGNGGLHKSPELLVSPNGLVNVIYTTIAPMLTGDSAGGYAVGNEVRLHSFSTVNNVMRTAIDQKTLLSAVPARIFASPANARLSTWRTPTATLDRGGNIHLLVPEANNVNDGVYAAFDPMGTMRVGPYRVPLVDGQTAGSLRVTDTKVLAMSRSSQPYFVEIDTTGSGLDLTGGAQVPLPEGDPLAVAAVSPANAPHRGAAIVAVSGTGFVPGTRVSIGGVELTALRAFDDATRLGELSAVTLADGVYDVVATNPDGTTATLPAAFTVGTPSSDGGCCDTGRSGGAGWLVLVLGVALGLRRRRRV